MLDPGRGDAVDRLRDILDTHGYAGPEATAALGAPIGPEHRPADLPLYRRRLAEPTPLHTLIQLFALHQSVPEAEARRAFDPVPIDDLAALGLVEREEGFVRPLVALAPSLSCAVAPSGMLILSGLTRDQERWVGAAYRNRGFVPRPAIRLGPWSTLAFIQKKSARRSGRRSKSMRRN